MGILFLLLQVYYAHLASVRFEHSVSWITWKYKGDQDISDQNTLVTQCWYRIHWNTLVIRISYIKDSGHFLEKINSLGCIPDNAILVTADVVGLYSSISLQAGLNALKEALDKRRLKKIPTDDLIKMAEFVLCNNFFEFNSDTFQQISGTDIGTKFALPYTCIYMNQVEQKFLATQINQPLIWLRYIDDIFLYGLKGKKN